MALNNNLNGHSSISPNNKILFCIEEYLEVRKKLQIIVKKYFSYQEEEVEPILRSIYETRARTNYNLNVSQQQFSKFNSFQALLSLKNVEYFYEKGYEFQNDYTSMINSIGSSSINSFNTIGYLFQNGYGVKQDYSKAMEYYLKAAETGNSDALFNIGNLYRNGYGVKQDFSKAMECYLQSAQKGNSDALNNIGTLYENGYGFRRDY